MLDGPSFVKLFKPLAAHCGICGTPGDWRLVDRTMQRVICPACEEPLLVAHRALEVAGLERPDTPLSSRNP